MSRRGALALCLGLAGATAACGADGGAGAPFDLPTAVSRGGPVLASARVQAIYLPGFAYAAELDRFLARLPDSAYWPAVTAEYGVGRPTIAPSHATTVPVADVVTVDDTDDLLAQILTEDAAVLGPPRADTIYLLFYPATTRIAHEGGAFCDPDQPAGFHAEANVDGLVVPFAVIPSCAMFFNRRDLTGASALTPAVSHELVEAATDPFPDSAPAFVDTDPLHPMWGAALGGAEVADLCENEAPNLVTPSDIGFPVQRSWSNVAARGGGSPCAPVPPGEVYFNAVGRLPVTVPVNVNGQAVTIAALRAGVSEAARVTVDLHGGEGAPASWDVTALELHDVAAPSAPLPPVTAQRGATTDVPIASPDARTGLFPLVVASHTRDGQLHLWVGTISRR